MSLLTTAKVGSSSFPNVVDRDGWLTWALALHVLGDPGGFPGGEVVLDRGPGREVRQQSPPLDAVVDHVEDHVHDRAAAVHFRSAAVPGQPRRIGQQQIDHCPLRIGGAGGVSARPRPARGAVKRCQTATRLIGGSPKDGRKGTITISRPDMIGRRPKGTRGTTVSQGV
jgi:hypothetical protein